MPRTEATLRTDALAIWQAGVDAVRSDRLVEEALHCDGFTLRFADVEIPLAGVRHIEVIGAGKAGTGMAAGVERALGPGIVASKWVTGWVNVPADCVRQLETIHTHAARPPGVNEPTPEGVFGSEEILRRVAALQENDICIAVISGGASALLPAPAEGVSLADKLAITRHLSGAGANIAELNTVRKQLSRIKGGGLLRACRAGWLLTLVISDVLGDPLDLIGSGPTVTDSSTPREALDILACYDALARFPAVAAVLQARQTANPPAAPTTQARTEIIGNNATAVDAAGVEAERRGYSMAMESARELEGPAEQIGVHLAQMARQMRDEPGPDCLIFGGEPTVKLAPPELRGRGGRNQQLALAALDVLADDPRDIVLLSGGTDGEDGPTDAAGAIVTPSLVAAARARGLDWREHLRRNDAYPFFDQLDGLIRTGPTHTNVCDLRVVVVDQQDAPVPR
ncbi:MAG: DUF4147 domain-containing protein [Planctomycetes bacterium]|nr:DUF4147 domain-containing protein [Planctomycetota bacterium]